MSDRNLTSILRLEQVSLQSAISSDFLLQDISVNISSGAKVLLVGASGAGKTSLLKLLNRLIAPNRGQIYFQDLSIVELSTVSLRQQIALVPQESKLLGMRVGEAIDYPLRLMELSESEILQRRETWTNLLHIPQSWFNKTELQLSLGQKQLVAIARTLVMQPRILLLDEPTSALDLGTATHLLQVLADLNQSQAVTIIMVNHQLDLIENFGDRILYLDRGKLAADLPSTKANWQTIQGLIRQSRVMQEQEWE